MKSIFKRATCLLIAISLLASLVGCMLGKDREPFPYNGIEIRDELPGDGLSYSENTEEYALEVISGLIDSYVIKAGADAFFGEAKQKEVAQRIQKITAEELISEDKYISFIKAVEDGGESVINALASKDGSGVDEAKELYLELCHMLGSDYIGRTLYRMLIWSYEYSHDKSMAEYEKYGYSYKLEDAEAALRKKDTLIADIGEDNFLLAVRSAMAVPEVIFSGALESEKMAAFSDEEILIFLSYMNFSSLETTKAGWELMLSYSVPKSNTSDTPYISKLTYTMNREGDLEELAGVMSELHSLVIFIQKNMDTLDIALLREGKRDEFLSRAFSKLGDAEWQMLDTFTSIEINSSKYEAQARREFGADFTEYAASIGTYTLDELRAAVGTEDFYKTLEGFIAGISPAFSYGMSK